MGLAGLDRQHNPSSQVKLTALATLMVIMKRDSIYKDEMVQILREIKKRAADTPNTDLFVAAQKLMTKLESGNLQNAYPMHGPSP